MLTNELFANLVKINDKPKPYSYYTTPELWCDEYISKQMLAYHISDEIELASRKKEFIERSTNWIFDYFNLDNQARICDFGCGPGLYTTRFAQRGAKVTGIDFSETSINHAVDQAKLNKLDIEYVLKDYLQYETDQRFNLITMIYCDFCVLSPEQRAVLLKKFYNYLESDGHILLDVSSFAHYAAKQEANTYEFSEKEGFWSADPYFSFVNSFKYEKEHLLLDKFTIIEKTRMREIYCWLQCYSVQTISQELHQNGFEVVEVFANVAGDAYSETATEIAVVARKSDRVR